MAVYVFFFISGFLVTGSWLRQRSLGTSLLSRVVRVAPAYAACLLLSALALGLATTTLPRADYLADPGVWRYVYWNLSFPEAMQFELPGVFSTHARQAVNGSLWTLPAEMRAYALLAAFGLLGLLDRLPRLLLALTMAFALVLGLGYAVPLVSVAEFVPMLGYFALGMLAWNARGVLPLHGGGALALIMGAATCRYFAESLCPYVFCLALCYGCLWFAYAPRRLLWFNRCGDYSYGLHLWGFPMQQCVVSWRSEPATRTITLLAWPLALLCAVVSWHLIEKPALAFRIRRSKGPLVASQPLAAPG